MATTTYSPPHTATHNNAKIIISNRESNNPSTSIFDTVHVAQSSVGLLTSKNRKMSEIQTKYEIKSHRA